MQSADDSAALRQYAESHSEDGFAALVARHINLVYSVALRQAGDPHQAEEITQAVFIILSKKAGQLRHDKALSSWLFQTTRLTANNFVRSEQRRRRREQEAHMQSVLNESGSDIWPRIAPLLDSAVAGLGEKDRRAIVLRFYEGRSLRDVGAALGASEDAAEKRVLRAVEKLREFFVRNGVNVGVSALAVVISANAVQAAPIGLSGTISSTVAAGAAIKSAATITAGKTLIMTTAQKALAAAVIAAAVAIPTVLEHQARMKMRVENESLRQQLSQQSQLAAENERLSNLVAQARNAKSMPDAQFSELLRLRSQVGMLRNQNKELEKVRDESPRLSRPAVSANSQAGKPDTEPAPENNFPKEAWTFAGYATPEAALQSASWAMKNGDVKAFFTSMTPETQKQAEKELADKSESEIAARNVKEMDTITGYRILKRTNVSEDEVRLQIHGDGEPGDPIMIMKRVGGEWKFADRIVYVTFSP